jgi:hypothetical protein
MRRAHVDVRRGGQCTFALRWRGLPEGGGPILPLHGFTACTVSGGMLSPAHEQFLDAQSTR